MRSPSITGTPASSVALIARAAVVGACALAPQLARATACPVLVPDERLVYAPTDRAAAATAPIDASADRVTSEDGLVTLDGDATLEWLGNRISTDSASYRRATGELEIDGALRLEGPGISLQSERAALDLDDDTLAAGRTEYRIDLEGRRATGDADLLARRGDGRFELSGATYSTCPPEQLDWYIRADRLTLDTEAGIGTARGLSLRFKDVPIFAVPAFSFPIGSQRKTGFLAPAVARSNDTGFELLVPWYWNIRPELDATFTPRLMSERGLQLQTEVRYLDESGIWTLDSEALRDRARDGELRHLTRLQHLGSPATGLTSFIDVSNVSDDDYFDDLGSTFQRARVTHLERIVQLAYADEYTRGFARLQDFQTVDLLSIEDDLSVPVEDLPYRRVPQIGIASRSPIAPLGLVPSVNGEFVFFDRRDSVTGSRLDVEPRLGLPLGGDAWFFEPSVSHRLTLYALDGAPDEIDETVARTTSTFALDSGLYFDRRIGNSGTVQTLEPRLHYLNVPFERQDDIPVFDSTAFDFDFAQLFRTNRYSGADRVADAHQLSLALTSRVIDGNDGRETLRASVGQILYFEDSRVRLPDEVDDAATEAALTDRSDLVAELAARFDRNWLARGSLQWNPDSNRTERGSLQLSFRPEDGRLLNVGHRIVNTGSRAETEQLDFSFRWPVGDTWWVSGRWNYSLDANVSLENLLGLEYESCCYALRFAARRYIADDNEDHETSVYLQLVLKGLAPVGQDYGRVLESAVAGYEDDV